MENVAIQEKHLKMEYVMAIWLIVRKRADHDSRISWVAR